LPSRRKTWIRDELVLALELYLRDGVVNLVACEPLSAELRAFPLEEHLADNPSFRNPDSVRSKLYNIQWLDTGGAHGRGKVGTQTVLAWEEFGRDRARVEAEAAVIRRNLAEINSGGGVVGEDDYEAQEGGIRIVAHRQRERDPELGRRKREEALRQTGALACEACGFDSSERWGVEGIIECHHLVPVSELPPGSGTKLSDVRLLCPNCHRLVHSGREWFTWEQLLAIVRPE
jgi:5-methylcytosine-specific restriction protein A